MFRPNTFCTLKRKRTSHDLFGKPLFAGGIIVPCSVVKLEVSSVASSVRADSSASRGAAEQEEAAAVLLFPRNVSIAIEDAVVIRGVKLRVISTHQRLNAAGKFDHTQVGFEIDAAP